MDKQSHWYKDNENGVVGSHPGNVLAIGSAQLTILFFSFYFFKNNSSQFEISILDETQMRTNCSVVSVGGLILLSTYVG